MVKRTPTMRVAWDYEFVRVFSQLQRVQLLEYEMRRAQAVPALTTQDLRELEDELLVFVNGGPSALQPINPANWLEVTRNK